MSEQSGGTSVAQSRVNSEEVERIYEETKWFAYGKPDPSRMPLFAFHYPGSGAASTYAAWPRSLGPAQLCPIQPPGRENRHREDPMRSMPEFAARCAEAIRPYANNKYAMIGHCGGASHMLHTAAEICAQGGAPPSLMIVSSWGAPLTEPYGRLNRTPLEDIDIVKEVRAASQLRLGHPLDPDLEPLVADVLELDLRLQRTARSGLQPPAAPILLIGWSNDEVVPSEEVWPSVWPSSDVIRFQEMRGDHWAYLRCEEPFAKVLEREMEVNS